MKAAEVDDRIRIAAQTIYQALIDAELTAAIGAGPWERSPERTAQRNGARSRVCDHHGEGSGAADREAAHRAVLSEPVGAIDGLAPQTQADLVLQAVAEQ